ncbi:hypothetical protein, partial [Pseudomonas agarici]
PTSYQTAPSRVCVAAFYRETPACQTLISENLFIVQLLSLLNRVLEASRGHALQGFWLYRGWLFD